MNRTGRVGYLILSLLMCAGPGTAQQRGTVSGQVVDVGTRQPLSGVTMMVEGTRQGTVTGTEGRYTIAGVAAGRQTVTASRLGYASSSQQVTIAGGETVTTNFTLAQSALEIGGIVVSAAGTEQRQREIGASIANIDVSEVEQRPVTNLSQVIQGRAPGVVVLPSTGTTGTGSRIRIRGSNSISLSNEPLLVIDGVRIDNDPEAFSLSVGGQSISRLNDINPEEIESIQILKGPAASALYGTAAANGVIQITTRKGRAGDTRWRFWSEQGSVREPTAYPDNVRNVGTVLAGSNAGQTTTNCNILSQAAGSCRPDSLVVFNPLEQNSPFRNGYRHTYGMSATGGAEKVTYFLSGELEGEDGVYQNNQLSRVNLRANLTSTLRPNLTATVSSGYISGESQLPYNDNAVEGFIGAGLLGNPTQVAATGGYFRYPKERRDAFELRQRPQRFLGSVNAAWTPFPRVEVIANAGMDVQNNEDSYTILPGIFTPAEDPDYTEGQREVNQARVRTYSATLSGNTSYDLGPDLSGQTTVGGQYNRRTYFRSDAFGQGLLAGTKSLNAASKLFSIDEINEGLITIGGFAQEQLTWRDRVYLSAALRSDKNSAFGQDFERVWYPSLSLSWVVDEEPFWRDNPLLSTLRLRTAWGQSGLNPEFRAATTYFQPVSAVRESAETPAFKVGGIGNESLRPERSTEYEIGFDAGLLDRRLGLEMTYYTKRSVDALVRRVLAPSLGAGSSEGDAANRPSFTRWENIGEVRNSGLEALLNIQALNRDPAQLTFTLTGTLNSNKLVTLGEGITPIIFGLGGNSQRHAQGFPLGGYWQPPIERFADANDDGIIEDAEIVVGDTAVFLGTPFPKREFSLNTELTLFHWLRVSALLDHKGGHKLFNSTEEFRCDAVFNCRAIQDPSTPLDQQARAVAAADLGTVAGYIEDADFTKLREVAVTLSAPETLSQRFGFSALSLTLSGRNLKTWTDYTGLDPEVNYAGQDNFSTAEFLTQPPVRYYIARIDVSF